MANSTNQNTNLPNSQPTLEDRTQLAYLSPLDLLDYAGLAIDAVERVNIELTMPEGREKDAARFMNNLYTAIDVVMAALPGGGGGGPAFRAAMATSREAAEAAWRALPDSVKAQLIKQVAQGMNWSIAKTQQAMNVFFTAGSNLSQGSPSQGDGSNRDNAADILGKNMEAGNKVRERNNQPIEPGWEKRLAMLLIT